jgi:signal peptidase I
MTTFLLLSSLLALGLLLDTLFLWLGARWVKASKPTFLRALICIGLISLFNVLSLVVSGSGQSALNPEDRALVILVSVGQILIGIFISCVIIKGVMVTSIIRAALVWLLGMVPTLFMLAVVFLVVRPYALEAFVIPTYSMAPTLVGWHKNGTCPHCGQPVFIPAASPSEFMQHRFQVHDTWGICSQCFRPSEQDDVISETIAADRIMVNKLMTPRRWDVIVFRLPENPSMKYAMRLVGLPGEEVFIKEGAIWVNGVKQVQPESIQNLQFGTNVGDGIPTPMGSPENPWILEEDEFCVLGDFSIRSRDSRFWGTVPRSHIEGVVVLRYWPASRWKVLR